MARIFSDGFDHYTSVLQKWDAQSGTPTISTASARFTISGLQCQGISCAQNNWVQKNFANVAVIITGFAWRPNLVATVNDGLFVCLDAGTAQVTLGTNSAGAFQFYRGTTAGTAIGSASAAGLVTPLTWHYLEIKITVSNTSTGTVELRVDGNSVITATGLNTQATANTVVNQVRYGEMNNAANLAPMLYDDLYLFDNSGGSLNTFLGPRTIRTLMPAGAGDLTQWTPSTGNNWQCVDEIPPNDDTDFVSTSTVNQRDLYTLQGLSITGNADFVTLWDRMRKDDVSARVVQTNLRVSGNDAFSANIAINSNYTFSDFTQETNPNGGGAWTQTALNALQAGHKLIA